LHLFVSSHIAAELKELYLNTQIFRDPAEQCPSDFVFGTRETVLSRETPTFNGSMGNGARPAIHPFKPFNG